MEIVKQIKLRTATEGDAEIINAWWNDGRVMAHAGFPDGLHQPLEKTIQLIKDINLQHSFMIIEIDNRIVGELSYKIQDNVATMRIKICEPTCRGLGYGTQVVHMLIDYLFYNKEIQKTFGVDKISLSTNLHNIRAQKFYERLGFKKVDTIINSWQDQQGHWQSSVLYELEK